MTKERFLSKVRKTDTCWFWEAALDQAGYGRFWYNNQMKPAYQVAYELFKGPRGSLHVLHSCSTRRCVNPDHLRLGTHAENMKDVALAKSHYLLSVDFAKAKKLREQGHTLQQIADLYSVSKQAILQGLKRHARY